MKLSTKGRYGLRLMLDLALHHDQGPVLLKDIAHRQGVSQKYLWHLIAQLKNAGLVNSFRGSRGGYALALPAHEITLFDILIALEGPISLVDCVDKAASCKRSFGCTAREVWQEVSHKVQETLKSFTLDQMMEKHNNRSNVPAYSI